MIFDQLDKNLNSLVDYEEFISACINLDKFNISKDMKAAFNYFDSDSNGKLALDEIKSAIKYCSNENSSDLINEIILKLDANKDGMIDFEEFVKILDSTH